MNEALGRIESLLSALFGPEGAALLADDLRIAVKQENADFPDDRRRRMEVHDSCC